MSTEGEHWSSMTAIERVRWIHSRFVENNETKSYDFRRECGLQLHMIGFGRRAERSVLTANDNYFQLAYRTGRVWQLVEKIFDMWDNSKVKGQQTDIKDDVEMKLTRWQHMQGIYDEAIVIPVLEKVVSRKLSLKEMGQEFAHYKVEKMVQQAFLQALEEETWSACKAKFKDHATDKIVKDFIPLFKGWKDPGKKKRPFTATFTEFPKMFDAHVQQAWRWYKEQQRTRTGHKSCMGESCDGLIWLRVGGP